MKKAIIYLTICLIPIISLGQMQENVERIKKDKKGSIYAVEFPPDIEKK